MTRSGKKLPPGQTHALAAFDLKTGKLLWQRWIDGDVMSAPVAVGQHLWATTFTGTLYKFDQRTGRILSAKRARATSAPVVVLGEVLQIRPGSGKIVKRYKVGAPVRSQPIVHKGWIYVGTQTGRLVAINTGDRSLTGWTQWGGNAARTSVR